MYVCIYIYIYIYIYVYLVTPPSQDPTVALCLGTNGDPMGRARAWCFRRCQVSLYLTAVIGNTHPHRTTLGP